MSLHPLATQLQFTRSEFMRGIRGVTDTDARKRLSPMNCISWNVGHLAWQEQKYFLFYPQGSLLFPEIHKAFAYGAPASTPPLPEVLAAWREITAAVDPWLEALTTEILLEHVQKKDDMPIYGNMLQRVIYHYWYHNGENQAIRQMLGHTKLPVFVGSIDTKAPYSAQ
ncbi:hypothetical protein LARV_01726 [Longilinea arvoryzae]|uniref:DinB-like domain-containing protein n=1 Tax=Longilinea arvoryzae TaxID=360412 RepID=A0A0S7B8W6_9CHLR|nr:DinB family protein [Longilinea arvoryzae]GAP13967.1 hypothetical protein LARV_01726 [Longilinea arvoryzae]